MKQFQIVYKNSSIFAHKVTQWALWREQHGGGEAIFHIFSEGADPEDIDAVCQILDDGMPDAKYVCCSASGIVHGGNISAEAMVITFTMFERESSFVHTELIDTHLGEEDAIKEKIGELARDYPGAKAIEIIMTGQGIPVGKLCTLVSGLPEEAIVFGGSAFSDNSHVPYVGIKGHERQSEVMSLVIMGGEELHATDTYVMGWKQLGMPFTVTKADKNVIYELDHEPAFKIYRHYLKLENDDNVFYNALEFPFAVSYDDGPLMRHAVSCDENDALTMSAEIEEGKVLHITYGDPETILDRAKAGIEEIGKFLPDVIAIFDCFGRKTFWGMDQASKETRPFETIAPSYGFCTAGELIKRNGSLKPHNLSLIVAGLREGEPAERDLPKVHLGLAHTDGRLSLVSRLANFIDTTTSELADANFKLSVMAVTDRLTELYNRGEIQRRITERIQSHKENPVGENATSLVMLDLDDFKHINDTYGHNEGDNVLQKVSRIIKEAVKEIGGDAVPGRWGGEEFMIMLPGIEQKGAAEFAEELRKRIAALKFDLFDRETASIGVAQAHKGENPDPLASRADEALYKAKKSGKNRVITYEDI